MNADEERRTGHSPKRKLHPCWNRHGQHNMERGRAARRKILAKSPDIFGLRIPSPNVQTEAPTLRESFRKKRGPGFLGKVGGALGRLLGPRKTG
jgi:hypothetical protein